jgi:DNA-binding LacI/PurR family transcriptional regulator
MNSATRAEGAATGGRKSAGLAERLQRRLEAGEIRVGGFTPSERELAREWGVGLMTARRALKLLESRGLLAAEPGQGYRVQGRALDPARGFPIAFVVSPAEAHLFTAKRAGQIMLPIFQRCAARLGVGFLVVGPGKGGLRDVVEQLESGRISGVLLDSFDPDLIDAVAQVGLPTVVVETWQPGTEVDSVVQDGFGGGLLAAQHLVSRGHKRFGWLGLDVRSRNPLVVDRFGGAVAGLAQEGLKLTRKVTGAGSNDGMRAAAMKLLSGAKRPTAVFALWQSASAGVSRAARELGLTVGKDFEMVGWANEEDYEEDFGSLFDAGNVPAAITWKMSSMAETALERLELRRNRPDLPAIQLRIPTRLRSHEDLWMSQRTPEGAMP